MVITLIDAVRYNPYWHITQSHRGSKNHDTRIALLEKLTEASSMWRNFRPDHFPLFDSSLRRLISHIQRKISQISSNSVQSAAAVTIQDHPTRVGYVKIQLMLNEHAHWVIIKAARKERKKNVVNNPIYLNKYCLHILDVDLYRAVQIRTQKEWRLRPNFLNVLLKQKSEGKLWLNWKKINL